MNRLNLLVASCLIALISGCSLSVKHRGQDGCGESGVYTSHHTCEKCGKKSRRFARTTPLYPGDTYGQWGDPVECGCGDVIGQEFSMEMGTGFVSGPFTDMSAGCSTCSGMMDSHGMMSGGCGAEGGAINPSYLTPPAVPQFAPVPAPAPVGVEKQARPIPAPVPPAVESPMPMPVPMPVPETEPSPIDQPSEPKLPLNEPNAQPYDEAPKTDDFGAGSEAAPAAPAGEIPADPVSWEVPQLPR